MRKTIYNMKTKTILTFLLLLVSVLSFGRGLNDAQMLRKVVLDSDVILASYNFNTTSNYANDYSIEQFYTINNTDTILKNATRFKITDKIKIQQQIRNCCLEELRPIEEIDTRYSSLFFLKKENEQYKLLSVIENIQWYDLMRYYSPAITQLLQIGEISNLSERYSKTIDWFIEFNDYPDEDFFTFYAQKGIPKNDSLLTKEQQKKATEYFLKGSDKLRPFVDKATQKAYSLKKLEDIRDRLRPEYLDFYFELSKVYRFDYNTVDYMLRSQLASSSFRDSNKKIIMDYFIKKLEEEIESEK